MKTILTNKIYYIISFFTFLVLGVLSSPYFNARFLLAFVLGVALAVLTLCAAGLNNVFIIFKFYEYMAAVSTLIYMRILFFSLSHLVYDFDFNILNRLLINNISDLTKSSPVCFEFAHTKTNFRLYDTLYSIIVTKLL